MNLTARTLLGLACLLAIVARAGDLDAPAVKPVTTRTEVQRGHGAVIDALDADHSPQEFEDALRKILSTNEQANTDTEAFRLGVAFGAWQEYWDYLSRGLAFERAGGTRLDATKLTAMRAQSEYEAFRGSSKRLGLTDAQLGEMFGSYGYDPARDHAAWEAAVKASAFKGTKREK